MLEVLKMQQDNSGIRRHTPDGIPVANKSGALIWQHNAILDSLSTR